MAEKTSISPAAVAGAHNITVIEAFEQDDNSLKHKESFMKPNYISNKDNIDANSADTIETEAAHASDVGLLPEIEDVDPDLLADAVEQLKNAMSDRAATSRENGALGGRRSTGTGWQNGALMRFLSITARS